ncbi:MAG: hypothetical protein NWF05_08795 [Candidatus Bathyarchaeota archaeon]|nr:hypothetical protein [Candidatus Bathyarchaeota archaeon]
MWTHHWLGLYWLGFTPFMPTAAIIAVTNALWVVIVGSILLALTYNFVRNRKLLYRDILSKEPVKRGSRKGSYLTVSALVLSAVCCFLVGAAFGFSPLALLPFVAVTLALAAIISR